MVVTASRQEAVRYKLAMDKYIAQSGYKDLATLVAFSGDVIDPESGPDKFSEATMNKNLNGRQIRKAFDSDDYQVLIVANKFQTGFDQPLLVAMYVDKRIDGITAVQTLSRLNRTYPGKDTTYVLDFVNDAETIRTAFEPYYQTTELLATTSPDLIYDIQTKIMAEQIYSEQEAVHVAAICIDFDQGGKKSQKDLIAALSAPVDRFKKRWIEAEEAGRKDEVERLETFHKNLGAFCRLYDFISQIVSYGDANLEASYLFYKCLEPLIRPDHIRLPIDLSAVMLTHHKVRSGPTVSVSLGTADDSERILKPITAVGTHVARDPVQARMDELIEQLNTLFDDGTLTDADRVGLFTHVADKMMENAEINKQALANSKSQFEQSPTISKVVVDAVIAAMDSYEVMGKKVFQDKAAMDRFQAMLIDHVYDRVNFSGSELRRIGTEMPHLFDVDPSQVARLDPYQFPLLINRLLGLEAEKLNIPPQQVDTTIKTTEPDGGIDARIYGNASATKWLPAGVSVWQFKSGQDHQRNNLLTEMNKKLIRETLTTGGTYVVVVAESLTSPKLANRRAALALGCQRLGVSAAKAYILWADKVAEWATEHPSLRSIFSGYSIGGLLDWSEWESQPISRTKFFPNAQRVQITSAIKEQFSTSSSSICRIEGLAGVGKSRLGLELFRGEENVGYQENLLYADSPQSIPPSIYEHIATIQNASLVLIVDECSREDHQRITYQVDRCGGRLKVVSIGINQRGSHLHANPVVYELDTLDDAAMTGLISDAYPLLPADGTAFIVRYASGYVKLAVAIADGIARRPELASPAQLARLDSVDELLRKFIFDSPEDQLAMQAIAIFERLGWDEDLETEAKAVADFLEMNWNDFCSRVRRFTQWGLIAKQGRYRYITPQILAIWLAQAQWEMNPNMIVPLIVSLPSIECRLSLIRRAMEVGEQQSNDLLVQAIMGSGGVVANISNLANEGTAAIFAEIAEAHPLIGVNALNRIILPLSRDDLLKFTNGRRHIVHLLEKLAWLQETFAEASRLLLKLGEAENEHYANNAGGVWVSLFGLRLGGTQVPAVERYPMILEALHSGKLEQGLLAVKAIAHTFSTHEVAHSIGDTIGGRKIPPRWSPATWDDYFDAVLAGFSLYDVAAQHPVESVRVAANKMLLDMTRSIMAVGLHREDVSDTLIDRLEAIPCDTYALQRELRQSVEELLAFEKDKIRPSDKARLETLLGSLRGSSYDQRVRRWVGRQTMEDGRFDKPDLPKPNQEIYWLAEEGMADEQEIIQLLPWLASAEAENVFWFAERLGELDDDQSLWPYIDECIGQTMGILIASAYLQGQSNAGRKKWRDDVLLSWSTRQGRASALLDAIWRSDKPNDHDAELIISTIKNGWLPADSLKLLSYGNQLGQFGQHIFADFLELLMREATSQSLNVAMRHIESRLRSHPDELPGYIEAIWKLIETPEAYTGGWERELSAFNLGKHMVQLDPARVARAVLAGVASDPRPHFIDGHALRLLHDATVLDPYSVWMEVAAKLSPLRSENYGLYLALRGSYGNVFDPNVLLAWADENPKDGPHLIASMCSVQPGPLNPLAEALLTRYGADSDAAKALSANFGSGSWTGKVSQWAEVHASSARVWAKSENQEIKLWATREVDIYEQEANRAKIEEEERGY